MPVRSGHYDSNPIADPAMTDSPLNCEALRERSIHMLETCSMMGDDLLNYVLGLIQKDAAEQANSNCTQPVGQLPALK